MSISEYPYARPGASGRGAYPAGLLAADRAFSSATAEAFQLPALALGYRPVYDDKMDQLGIQAEADGFLQAEGAWYCPSISKPLVDATRDYRNHIIDDDAYRKPLLERQNYRARPRAKPDDEGHVRLQCPAAGSCPIARCELKPASISRDTRGRLHMRWLTVWQAQLRAVASSRA